MSFVDQIGHRTNLVEDSTVSGLKNAGVMVAKLLLARLLLDLLVVLRNLHGLEVVHSVLYVGSAVVIDDGAVANQAMAFTL